MNTITPKVVMIVATLILVPVAIKTLATGAYESIGAFIRDVRAETTRRHTLADQINHLRRIK